MRSRVPRACFAVCAVLLGLVGGCTPSLEVDRLDDDATATACTPAPNDCSLRGAIIHTNAMTDSSSISVPAGVFILGIPGADEDTAATGDLDITRGITVTGAGAGLTIVDGNALDRVFDIDPAGTGISVSITGLTIQNGLVQSESGQGIRAQGDLTLEAVEVIQNGGDGAGIGGGIAVGDTSSAVLTGSLTLDNSTVRSNVGLGLAGGIFFDSPSGTLSITHSTVSGNRVAPELLPVPIVSLSQGGGLWIGPGSASIMNSTVSDNQTNPYVLNGPGGAGILLYGSTLDLVNTTFSDNHADEGGADLVGNAIEGDLGRVTFANTLLDRGGCLLSSGSTGVSNGGNLEQGSDTCGLHGSDDQVNVPDAMIGPLASNGGLTETHALLPGSPAIDQGLSAPCPSDDQRGYTREDGLCDVGAFELGATSP